METGLNLQAIVDQVMKDITRRVGGVELHSAGQSPEAGNDVSSLSTVTAGSYRLSLVCCAENQFLHHIAQRMKRRPIEDEEEVELYTQEYFNVICGHIVSAINRSTNSSARFGIPQFSKGACLLESPPEGCQNCTYREGRYQSEFGGVCIRSAYLE